jgi:hypothetical protein
MQTGATIKIGRPTYLTDDQKVGGFLLTSNKRNN